MNGEFWNVFTTSRNAMLLADDERRYIAGNDAALALLGLTTSELGRLRIDDLTPEHLRGGIEEMWSSFLANGSLHGHYTLVLPSGRRLDVEYSATAHVLPGRHLSILLERDGGAHVRETLTAREREVVRHIAEGATTQEIAQRLFISATTVDTHVRKAMLRLGAKNRAHLIALALQQREI